MFQPSQADVRRFFCGVYDKLIRQAPMEPIETLAGGWIEQHPEYHRTLADLDQALADMQQVQSAQENPFLHLSMHLALREQVGTDRPAGIAALHARLAARHGRMDAEHRMMEALGRALWEAQRAGRLPDERAYLEDLRRLG